MKKNIITTIISTITAFVLVILTKDPFISIGIMLFMYLLIHIMYKIISEKKDEKSWFFGTKDEKSLYNIFKNTPEDFVIRVIPKSYLFILSRAYLV